MVYDRYHHIGHLIAELVTSQAERHSFSIMSIRAFTAFDPSVREPENKFSAHLAPSSQRAAIVERDTGALHLTMTHVFCFQQPPEFVGTIKSPNIWRTAGSVWRIQLPVEKRTNYLDPETSFYLVSEARLDNQLRPGIDHLYVVAEPPRDTQEGLLIFLILRPKETCNVIPTFEVVATCKYMFYMEDSSDRIWDVPKEFLKQPPWPRVLVDNIDIFESESVATSIRYIQSIFESWKMNGAELVRKHSWTGPNEALHDLQQIDDLPDDGYQTWMQLSHMKFNPIVFEKEWGRLQQLKRTCYLEPSWQRLCHFVNDDQELWDVITLLCRKCCLEGND
jgi:hypothetical protein